MEGAAEVQGARSINTIEDAIEDVLMHAIHVGGVVRGIHQACKAIETPNQARKAKVVFLSEAVEEEQYKQVVEALCKEKNIPCLKVKDSKELGRWAGLCKLDLEGNARSIVPTGVVCITDYGIMKEGYQVLQKHLLDQ